jgi:auxin responsive GH3 family protein
MAVDSAISSPLGPPACEKDTKALQFIEETTRNADAVQERVLAEILSRNAETEYLKRFKLHGTTADHDTFKSVDLCVETLAGEDVLALREIGVFDRSN